MTSPQLLVPLRIPELGPSLGRLVAGPDAASPGLGLAAPRIQLVTRLLQATGEARRLAANGARGSALAAVSSPVWQSAWEDAVGAVAEQLSERINRKFELEARAVRMPARRRRALLLDTGERRALAARLGSAGGGLVAALDELDAHAARLEDATVKDKAVHADWQAAFTTAGRRLEAAWIALEELAAAEADRWDEASARVAEWRKPLWPVAAVGVPLLVAAGWLGLVLGGYVPPPWWLEGAWQAVFR